MKKALLLALLVVAAAPAAAQAATPKRPPVRYVRGDGSYTKASRAFGTINRIVVHATDGGSLGGNIWWLSGRHSHASAHYVVGRDGEIVQLVHLSDIAWHAGNWKTNVHSVGIEHVGETDDPVGFTLEEYRRSARLAGWLARRYAIPIDRRHIIGHYQVPDPKDPSAGGGADHHTDPGPFWRWGLYMRLVREYAYPERYRLRVTAPRLPHGTVGGIVPVRAATQGTRARRVDFLVDGRLRWRDTRAPFWFAGGRGWNTTRLSNGAHVLTLRAFGDTGVAVTRYVVRVHNLPFELTTSKLRDWQKVRSVVRVRANVRGARSDGIELFVDRKAMSRDRSAPYTLLWDSRRVGDGRHVVVVATRAVDGRTARRRLTLVVANHPHAKPAPRPKPKPAPRPKPKPAPRPKPKPAPRPAPKPVVPTVAEVTPADGQTVSGTVEWQARPTGPVVRVEFLVDGVVRGVATVAPWSFAWDTAAETPGAHRLTVRAVTTAGRRAEASVTVAVTVTPPPPPPPPPAAP